MQGGRAVRWRQRGRPRVVQPWRVPLPSRLHRRALRILHIQHNSFSPVRRPASLALALPARARVGGRRRRTHGRSPPVAEPVNMQPVHRHAVRGSYTRLGHQLALPGGCAQPRAQRGQGHGHGGELDVRDCLASPYTLCNTFTRYGMQADCKNAVGADGRQDGHLCHFQSMGRCSASDLIAQGAPVIDRHSSTNPPDSRVLPPKFSAQSVLWYTPTPNICTNYPY